MRLCDRAGVWAQGVEFSGSGVHAARAWLVGCRDWELVPGGIHGRTWQCGSGL